MFFSVIVTVFNGEDFLAPCLDSILRNRAGNYELILINDGSTDDTTGICDGYAAQYGQIKCVHTPNRGIGNARQAGLEKALGEYVVFVDGDDLWDDSFDLGRMEEDIKANPADLFVFGFILRKVNPKGIHDTPYRVKAASFENWRDNQAQFLSTFPNGLMYFCWNKIFRRQVIVDNNIMSVQQHMEDFRFVLDYLKAARKVVFLSIEPYIHLKRGNQSLMSMVHRDAIGGNNICHTLFLSLFDQQYADSIHQIMASVYLGTITHHINCIDRHQDVIAAKTVLAEASRNDLAQVSLSHYHPFSFSEKVTVFLMRHGRFGTLRRYRKLVDAVKRYFH